MLETEVDILGLAQTGTGKTAAFGLPLLQLIDYAYSGTQSIILCPTRELCRQITDDLQRFSAHLDRMRVEPVYGGASIMPQISALRRGVHIVVGTPGRVVDLINRGALDLSAIRYVVLDEADEMLNMGFKDDLDFILSHTPEFKQVFLFSATMPAEVSRIASTYMNQPVEISVGEKNRTASKIEHHFYKVGRSDRYAALKRIVDFHPGIYGIIFCRTRKETQDIADKLISDGYNADALHGDLSQAQRDLVMSRFRQRYLQLLVATDVAARGIDVDDISHVINYNLPDDPEVYVHRSGRTARAGREGISLSLIAPGDKNKFHELNRKLGKQMEAMLIPDVREICARQLVHLAREIHDTPINEVAIDQFMPEVEQIWADMSREDLIKKVLSEEFNRLYNYYKHAQDLNQTAEQQHDRKGRNERSSGRERDDDRRRSGDDRRTREGEGRRGRDGNFKRFHINLGKKDKLSAQRLMGLINESPELQGARIGRIQIMKKFSIFEIDEAVAKKIRVMEGGDFEGQRVFVKEAEMGFEDFQQEEPRRSHAHYREGHKRGPGGGQFKRKEGGFKDKKSKGKKDKRGSSFKR